MQDNNVLNGDNFSQKTKSHWGHLERGGSPIATK
jgi:hypothetical protein